jgi:ATP-dependent helicase HrpA
VDDELIFAFYDQQLPADVCSGYSFERWYREEVKKQPQLLMLTREELMRHEAAGITTAMFPKTVRLGGVDCLATYLHEPGDVWDGLTVTVPLFVLNQVSEERCEWLVPGMLKEKIQALIKTLHQRPRSRLVPLPETASRWAQILSDERFGAGTLVDALLKLIRDQTALDIVRADIKADMLSTHFFMNFKVVDEHGRQLGQGRNLGALKAEWGKQARGAFQALASLKLGKLESAPAETAAPLASPNCTPSKSATTTANKTTSNTKSSAVINPVGQRYTAWTFGELPELLEIQKGGQTLVGFPALIDAVDAVTMEVFDEPELAAEKHRAGLRRLFALQLKEPLKYLEKNVPDLQKMAVAFMQIGGTIEELREQIIGLALERAFLLTPLPTDAFAFKRRLEEGRGRLTLIANEIARLAALILQECATANRKIKDTKTAPEACADAAQQLQRLVPKRFLMAAPWERLHHLTRYLKAITLRLEKIRADPARDAARLAELRPQEQRYWRLVAERKGVSDERMTEFRWLLEELRVSFFAQELRTPQPVSVKRLDKAWSQLL